MLPPRHVAAGVLSSLLILSSCSLSTTATGGAASTLATSSAVGNSSTSGSASLTGSAASTSTGSSAASSLSATVSAGSAATPVQTSSVTTQTTTQQSGSTTAQTVAGVPTPQLVAASAPVSESSMPADAIINVAKKDTPGVVQITNEQVQLGSLGSSQAVPTGVGTGIVIDSKGDVLTNDHVVRGAQKLVVTLADGSKEYPATLVGADSHTDLAVVKVSGTQLTPLALGDSSKLAVGQWVVAIGNALALPGGPTVTAGVVSALGRTVQEPPIQTSSAAPGAGGATPSTTSGPYLFDVIQTSAPINPGNSGGPLVDLNGEVVGINTLAAVQTQPGGPQAQGIGFAIAINTARKIATTLIAQGHVDYPYLGIDVVTNSPALAAQYGLPSATGVAVVQLPTGSPAAAAGVRSKDVITAIDGQAITDTSNLSEVLASHKPGDKVMLTWVRAPGNQKVSKTVTLGTAPSA